MGEHTISTEGGVGDRVLLPRERRETDYYYAGRGGRWFFVMRKRNCHVNTGLYVLPTKNIDKQQ